MRLPLQVSAVLSAIVLSFCTAPVRAIAIPFIPNIPGYSTNNFTYELFAIPSKWGEGPNSATNLNISPASLGTPGSATWSVMGSGLSDDPGGLADFHPQGETTTDFTALLTAGVAGDGVELAMIDEALNLWDAFSGFTNLGIVSDGGVNFGAAAGVVTNGVMGPGGSLGDIRIGAIAIDRPLGILGHAFQPGTEAIGGTGGTIYGDIHLDNAERWVDSSSATGTSNEFDLFTVLLHELGHALGLGHSTNPDSVMFASYNGVDQKLNTDDIFAINYLYGPQLASETQSASVPEPGTLTLLGLGLAGLVAGIRLTKKAAREE